MRRPFGLGLATDSGYKPLDQGLWVWALEKQARWAILLSWSVWIGFQNSMLLAL